MMGKIQLLFVDRQSHVQGEGMSTASKFPAYDVLHEPLFMPDIEIGTDSLLLLQFVAWCSDDNLEVIIKL